MTSEERDAPQRASELIGYDSSALSLDGRSLNIPNDGTDEDMSSLGTSKNGGYNFSTGNAIGYIGDMRIIGRAEEYDNEEEAPVPPYRSPMPSPYPHSGGASAGDYDFQRTDYSVQTEEKDGDGPPMIANKKEEDKKKNKTKSGCLPGWIVGAPFWLKIVIICSTALLIGAVVLIGVGAALAKGGLRSSSDKQDQNQSSTPAEVPAPPGVTTTAPTASAVQTSPPAGGTGAPTENPTKTPLDSTLVPNSNTTGIPADDSTGELSISSAVNFFAIGGRFDDEALSALTDDLQTLPNINGNTVMFHLGDWNSPYATSCEESSYSQNVEVYQQSSIPVYFVPGDNEFNGTPKEHGCGNLWSCC